jgi:hypothetical protein
MERAAGIEPAYLTWKDRALPLSYARAFERNQTAKAPANQVFSVEFAEIVLETFKSTVCIESSMGSVNFSPQRKHVGLVRNET